MEIATEQRESELAYLVATLDRDGYAVVDNGSRSIELVSREAGMTRQLVSGLGYRVAYDTCFARADTAEDAVTRYGATMRLFSTSNTPLTSRARTSASWRSALLSTTPSSIIRPFFTMM